MRWVEFYSYTTGEQQTIGKALLQGNVIRFEGLRDEVIQDFYDNGIRKAPNRKGTVFPKDGLLFLKSLRYEFTGSMFRASDVLGVV